RGATGGSRPHELARAGPSAELAHADLPPSGVYKFQLDHAAAVEAGRKGVAVARAAGADFERIWATSWLAFALFDTGHVEEGLAMLDECFAEAVSRGYVFIAQNVADTDAITRLHTLLPGITARLASVSAEPGAPATAAIA